VIENELMAYIGISPKYERRIFLVKKDIKDMYLAGVSTRRGEEILELLGGCHPSAKTFSLLTKELDEEGFRRKESISSMCIWDKELIFFMVVDSESEETSSNSERWSMRSSLSIGGGSI
ncbi:MAG: transposase, partial [Candidatus Aminicenantales bacterium]